MTAMLNISRNALKATPMTVGMQHHLLHSTRSVFAGTKGKFPDETLDQGNTSERASGVKDTQAEHAKSGLDKRKSDGEDANAMDAASPARNPTPQSVSEGSNPEKIGFSDQVGGQASSADNFKGEEGRTRSGDEEAQPPGVLSSVKRLLGFGTNSGDVKQNRDGGSGVTGTGTFSGSKGQERRVHTSVPRALDSNYHRVVQKDAPSAVDYMADVASSLAETKLAAGTQRAHNLTRRCNELAAENERQRSTSAIEDLRGKQSSKLEAGNAEHNISPPRSLPGGRARNTEHEQATGDWSMAGLGDKQYRNVGVKEEPYEPPADDEDDGSKVDARAKKLRYGGLAKDPKVV